MQVVLENIKKSYGKKEVLKDISFTFESGKIYGLLGRNGAGKTTLFDCVSKEIKVDSGKAYFLDKNKVRREVSMDDIGYVLSTPILPEFLTGEEFVKFLMDVNEDKIPSNMKKDEYFNMVQMDRESRGRLIKEYSHGMKNKIQMLSFIICQPPVVLLDEPLTSLDVVVALEMKKIIKSMKDRHIIIFSTHMLQLAVDLCDEILILNDGVIQQLESSMLKDKNFEGKIVELLKDGKEDE